MDGAPIKRVRLNNEFRPPSFPPFQKCPHHRTHGAHSGATQWHPPGDMYSCLPTTLFFKARQLLILDCGPRQMVGFVGCKLHQQLLMRRPCDARRCNALHRVFVCAGVCVNSGMLWSPSQCKFSNLKYFILRISQVCLVYAMHPPRREGSRHL